MNIYNCIAPEKGELTTLLLENKNIKINRIVSSNILDPIEYLQKEDEWVMLVEGEAVMEINGCIKKLQKGDILFIPALTAHKILKTESGTIWLAVHIF